MFICLSFILIKTYRVSVWYAKDAKWSLGDFIKKNKKTEGSKQLGFGSSLENSVLDNINQSIANNFYYGQIRIWILFAKDIFYKYKYEYYSWHLMSGIWIRIIFVKIFTNIFKIWKIFEYLKIIKPLHTFISYLWNASKKSPLNLWLWSYPAGVGGGVWVVITPSVYHIFWVNFTQDITKDC